MTLTLKDVRDRATAEPLVSHLEDAPHDRRGVGIGLEGAEPNAGDGLVPLRVWDVGVDTR